MRKFSICLLNIKDEEIKFSINIVERFIASVKDDFHNTDFEEEAEARKAIIQKSKQQNRVKRNNKKALFGKSKLQNLFLIVRLWPVLITLGIAILYSHFYYLNNLKHVNKLHRELTTATKTIYMNDLAAASGEELIIKNMSTTVRGNPIFAETVTIISYLSNIDELVNTYREDDGTLAPAQAKYLFNFNCTELEEEDHPLYRLRRACNTFSKGTGIVSVTSLMVDSSIRIRGYIDKFAASDRSVAKMVPILNEFINVVTQESNILSGFLRGLWNATDAKFDQHLITQENSTKHLIVATTFIVIIIACFALPRALKSIYQKENQLKSILRLVPLSVILKNRMLKSYLVKTSGKLGWSVNKAT